MIFDKKYNIYNIVKKFEVQKKNRKSLLLLQKQIPPNCVTDVMPRPVTSAPSAETMFRLKVNLARNMLYSTGAFLPN